MKYYIVKWKDKETLFTNIREAVTCAENISATYFCSSYVFSYVFEESLNGIREDEPFFNCKLEI